MDLVFFPVGFKMNLLHGRVARDAKSPLIPYAGVSYP